MQSKFIEISLGRKAHFPPGHPAYLRAPHLHSYRSPDNGLGVEFTVSSDGVSNNDFNHELMESEQ